jgi:hypothetical protein
MLSNSLANPSWLYSSENVNAADSRLAPHHSVGERSLLSPSSWAVNGGSSTALASSSVGVIALSETQGNVNRDIVRVLDQEA